MVPTVSDSRRGHSIIVLQTERGRWETDRQTGRDKDRDRETDQPTVRVSGLLMTSADVYYSTSVTDIPTHQRPGQYNNKQIGFTGFKPKTTNTTTTSHRHMDKKQTNKKPCKV